MIYKCEHCSQTFATPYALKRHISDKYQYIAEDEGETSRLNILSGIWDNNLPIKESDLWDDDLPTEDQIVS